jgi:hypothetical protein
VQDANGFIWGAEDKDSAILSIDGGDQSRSMAVYHIAGFSRLMSDIKKHDTSAAHLEYDRQSHVSAPYTQWITERMNQTFEMALSPYNQFIYGTHAASNWRDYGPDTDFRWNGPDNTQYHAFDGATWENEELYDSYTQPPWDGIPAENTDYDKKLYENLSPWGKGKR